MGGFGGLCRGDERVKGGRWVFLFFEMIWCSRKMGGLIYNNKRDCKLK